MRVHPLFVLSLLSACGVADPTPTTSTLAVDAGEPDLASPAGGVAGGPCGTYGALCCGLGQGQAGTCLDGSACVLDTTGGATAGTGCVAPAPTLGCQVCDKVGCGAQGGPCCLAAKACRDGSACSDVPSRPGSVCR